MLDIKKAEAILAALVDRGGGGDNPKQQAAWDKAVAAAEQLRLQLQGITPLVRDDLVSLITYCLDNDERKDFQEHMEEQGVYFVTGTPGERAAIDAGDTHVYACATRLAEWLQKLTGRPL